MADNHKTAFELERDARIAENKRRLQELGVADAAAALEAAKPAVKRQRREKKPEPSEPLERRVSSRERKAINYSEMEGARASRGEPRAPVDYTERIQGITLDQSTAEQLRADLEAKQASKKAGGKSRGPVDSGKGVRIQGGRVYDSKHGVTCHWCRQKTLEDHVTCTNPGCGNGRRMPLSFCAKCLRNRHGEDYEAADASGGWWCPSCRGSCGPGCVTCCNCGPCRKRAGLDPTHQVVKLARDAGFDNVHDYLVHLVTGETTDVIAERKLGHSWGAWLKPGGGSDASEQTGGCAGNKACSSHQHAAAAAAAGEEGEGDAGSAGEAQQVQADAADAEQQVDQRSAAARSSKAGRKKQAKAPAGKAAAGKAAAGKGRGRGKAGAAAAAEEEKEQQQEEEEEEGQGKKAAPARPAEEQEEADDDVPMLSSQDTKLSRKQRIMQSLGLAPVTVCA